MEWKRGPHAGNFQPIFSGSVETAEIRLVNFLVRRRQVFVALIEPGRERSLIDLRTSRCADNREPGINWDRHFTKVSEIMSNHCLLGVVRHVTLLIDMDGGAETIWICAGDKSH